LQKVAIIAAALSALVSTAAFAESEASERFTVINQTGYDIREVYISPSRNNDWEEDVLGRDLLEDESRTVIDFTRSEDVCLWDMKVVYTDDDTAEWDALNLCEISVVALNYDGKTGRTWATTD